MAGPESSSGDGYSIRNERTIASISAPIAQTLLYYPSKTDTEVQKLKERDPSFLYAISPLYAVLGHLVTMPMLSDMIGIPISRPLLQSTEKGVLSTLSPKVLELRMKPDSTQGFGKKEESEFVRLQMEGFNPYFDSAITRIMDPENPYYPVWQAFAEIVPLYLSKRGEKDPVVRKYNILHEAENPINSLHVFFWEGFNAPIRHDLVPSFIYSDTISSVGKFQRQAIANGIVGLFAQQSEISRQARKNNLGGGPYLPLAAYNQNSETAVTSWGTNLAKGIKKGVSKCPVPYGLLSPDQRVNEMANTHNDEMGEINRSGVIFCPIEIKRNQIESASEVIAYRGLLNAPSTLWLPFLESKEITDWSDVLPGTRLPDGQVRN